MKTSELRKQISLFVPLSEWKAIRREAARRKMPITELCREWLRPELSNLLRESTRQATS
jgi:hypothetical protein